VVMSADIDDDKSTGEVNRTECDRRIRSGSNAGQDGQEIKTGSRIDGEAPRPGQHDGKRGS